MRRRRLRPSRSRTATTSRARASERSRKLFLDRQLVVDTSVVDALALRLDRSLARARDVVDAGSEPQARAQVGGGEAPGLDRAGARHHDAEAPLAVTAAAVPEIAGADALVIEDADREAGRDEAALFERDAGSEPQARAQVGGGEAPGLDRAGARHHDADEDADREAGRDEAALFHLLNLVRERGLSVVVTGSGVGTGDLRHRRRGHGGDRQDEGAGALGEDGREVAARATSRPSSPSAPAPSSCRSPP
jgi:hypothetical protein